MEIRGWRLQKGTTVLDKYALLEFTVMVWDV
jgi:hypothetical protein